MGTGIEVLVPIKPIRDAKSRLSGFLNEDRRSGLTLYMLYRVLQAVRELDEITRCRVVGGDSAIRHVTESLSCAWGFEPGHDLNSSLALAMHQSFAAGASASLILPADLPFITATDIELVIQASRGCAFPTGVRAAKDGGTNALLVPSSMDVTPVFGEDSYSRHESQMRTAGTKLMKVEAPGLYFDVDTPDDFKEAMGKGDGFPEGVRNWEHWVLDLTIDDE